MMFTLDVSHWNIFNAYNFKYFFFLVGCRLGLSLFRLAILGVSHRCVVIHIYLYDVRLHFRPPHHISPHTLPTRTVIHLHFFFFFCHRTCTNTTLYIYLYIHSVSQTPKLLWKLNCKYYRGGDLPYGLPAIHGLRVGNMYLFSVTFLFGVFFFSCSLLSYVSRLTTVIHLECSYRKP